MNVLITNKQEALLADLDIEIIKTLRGEYDVEELIGIFSNFFFGRMILDITAIKNYQNIANIQKLSIGLPVEKIIILLPADSEFSSNGYLSKLISMGFYNFANNLEGVKYLIDHPNNYKDVAYLHQLDNPAVNMGMNQSNGSAMPNMSIDVNTTTDTGNNNNNYNYSNNTPNGSNVRVIGIKNVTDSAGATTLTYMMKKELEQFHGMRVKAIEINKRDFMYFHAENMVSINKTEYLKEVASSNDFDLIIVDMNDLDPTLINEVIYLIEPSIIKINKLVKRDQRVFERIDGKKIVLNKSLISNEDINEFSVESGLRIFTALKPINDRAKKQTLTSFLSMLGLIKNESVEDEDDGKNRSGFASLFKF